MLKYILKNDNSQILKIKNKNTQKSKNKITQKVKTPPTKKTHLFQKYSLIYLPNPLYMSRKQTKKNPQTNVNF